LVIANDTHLLAAPVRLYKDVETCVTVIAGTGSIVVSFRDSGGLQELGRVGGWGWLLGDEGGGFHVGREAIRKALTAYETKTYPHSTLTRALLELYKISEIPEILPLLHTPDPASNLDLPTAWNAPPHISMAREKRFSTLSPLVFRCAFEDQDELALSVLDTCASELVSQICSLLSPDASGHADPRKPTAADSILSLGGSLSAVDGYRNSILSILKQKGHVFRHVVVVDDAAGVGAAGLAAAQEASK
jgi:hypothetical protein